MILSSLVSDLLLGIVAKLAGLKLMHFVWAVISSDFGDLYIIKIL